jgi:hypothetical protein
MLGKNDTPGKSTDEYRCCSCQSRACARGYNMSPPAEARKGIWIELLCLLKYAIERVTKASIVYRELPIEGE